MLTTDQLMSRAETLARQAGGAGVHDDQLSLILVHLKRHRDIAATLVLLSELRLSSFAHRSRSTPAQFKALEESVRPALLGVSSWEDAAGIVGWARRLLTFHSPRTGA
ncbi:MAG TPA: hypothetical protein VLB76_14335 [Thermoanaerobaculia bacterium]|jgi:hypothetical protein|nr:hypothetical protein [Thermoanaerobaculia bacterium]